MQMCDYLEKVLTPSDFNSLVAEYKKLKSAAFLYWRDMNASTLWLERKEFLERLPTLDTVKKCMGLSVFARYMPESRSDFMERLVDLERTGNFDYDKFILRSIAKRCRKMAVSLSFIDVQIWDAEQGNVAPQVGLAFAEQFVEKAPKVVINYAHKFLGMLFSLSVKENSPFEQCLDVTRQFLCLVKGHVDFSESIVFSRACDALDKEPVVRFLEVLFAGTPSQCPKDLDYEKLKDAGLCVLASRVDRLEDHRSDLLARIREAGNIVMFSNSASRYPLALEDPLYLDAVYQALLAELGGDVQHIEEIINLLVLIKNYAKEKYDERKETLRATLMANPNAPIKLVLFVLGDLRDVSVFDVIRDKFETAPVECLTWLKENEGFEGDASGLGQIAQKMVGLLVHPEVSSRVKVLIMESALIEKLSPEERTAALNAMLTFAFIDPSEKVRLAAVNNLVRRNMRTILQQFPTAFYTFAQDASPKVKVALFTLLCEWNESSATVPTILREVLCLNVKEMSLTSIAEHTQVLAVIFSKRENERKEHAVNGIVTALWCLEQRLGISEMNYFENRYWKAISRSSVTLIDLVVQHNFDLVQKFASEIWEVLAELLNHVRSEVEIRTTLTAIESMIKQQGIEPARQNAKLHSALYSAGAKTFSSETHTVLLRILGTIGVVVPSPQKRPRHSDFFDERFKNSLYKLRNVTLRATAYEKCALSVLFGLLESNASSRIKLAVLDLLYEIFRRMASKRVQKHLPLVFSCFWRITDRADRTNAHFIRLLTGLCCIGGDYLRQEVVDGVIEFGSIKPLKALAVSMKRLLAPRLRELIDFVYNAKDGNPSKVFLFFLWHCDPPMDFVIELLGHLIHRTNINPTAKQFGILAKAFQIPLSETSIPMVMERASAAFRLCMSWLSLPECRSLLYVLLVRFAALRNTASVVKAQFLALRIPMMDLESALSGHVERFVSKDDPKLKPMPQPERVLYPDLSRGLVHECENLRASRGDLKDEFESFVYFCIDNAPDFCIRACSQLAHESYVTAIKLFNCAFHAVYTSCSKTQGVEQTVSTTIWQILSMRPSPKIASNVMDLVEFMDRAGSPILVLDGKPLRELKCIENPAALSNAALALRCALLRYGDSPTDNEKKILAAAYTRTGMYRQAAELNRVQATISDWRKCLPDQYHGVSVLDQALGQTDNCDLPALFAQLGDLGGPSFVQGVSVVIPYVIAAQGLIELSTLSERTGLHQRFEGPYSLFSAVNAGLLLRIDALSRQGKDAREEKETLLHYQAKVMEWDMFRSGYDLFYAHADQPPVSVQLDYARFLLSTMKSEDQEKAEHIINELIDKQTEGGAILDELKVEKALLLLRKKDGLDGEALKRISDDLETVTESVKSNYLWALVCLRRHDHAISSGSFAKAQEFGVEAVKHLAYCSVHGEKKRTSDLLQMFELVFGGIIGYDLPMSQVRHYFDNIPLHSLVPLINQLIYYYHPGSDEKGEYMKHLLTNLLSSFGQGLIWAYLFSDKCDGVVHNAPDAPDGTWQWQIRHSPISEVVMDARQKNSELDLLFHQAETMFDGFEKLCWRAPEVFYEVACNLMTLFQSGLNQSQWKAFVRDNRRKMAMLCKLWEKQQYAASYDRRWMRAYRADCANVYKICRALPLSTSAFQKIRSTPLPGYPTGIKIIVSNLRNACHQTVALKVSESAPELSDLEGFQIPVFGTYSTSRATQITIKSMVDQVEVIKSKVRPRIIRLVGVDGHTYKFILKGRDDLRIDQRSMQVIELVNTLVKAHIVTYSITPLSASMGVIQYLNGTKSMWAKIMQYRQFVAKLVPSHRRRIPYEVENDMYLDLAGKPDYGVENFRVIPEEQKLEYYREVAGRMENRVNDLREILWLSASSSATWLSYQRNFTTSAAVMSIVGNVIGLGDRHPNNILIDSATGTLVHIDFGDALWTAVLRPLLKETVPFRLTRMMTAAMGPTGYDGPFRSMAEHVMTAMKSHGEAIMSILRVFEKAPIWAKKGTALNRAESSQLKAQEMGESFVKKFAERISGVDGKTVKQQVDELIKVATSDVNLSKMYLGWQPFW